MSLGSLARHLLPKPEASRLLQLDVLRGVAILLVLFTHASLQPEDSGVLRPVLAYLRYLGPSGVDLFFVLSGFLIGGLLLHEIQTRGQLDIRRFLIRRGFKIWPSYFAFLAFVAVWLLVMGGVPVVAVARRLAPNLLHVQNYLGSPREHTWSLAVEEHFYLALPFALAWMLRRRATVEAALRAVPFVALALVVACGLLRLQAYAGSPRYNPHFATHLRIDALFFGVALAYACRFVVGFVERVTRHRGALLLAGTALLVSQPALLMGNQSNRIVGTTSYTMVFVAYGCVLLAIVHAPVGQGFIGRILEAAPSRAVAVLGYFSYPVYLWHIDATRPIDYLFARERFTVLGPELRWLVAFALYVLLAFVVGAIFAALIDKPSLALRDRLFPPTARPVGVPAYTPMLGAKEHVAIVDASQ